MIIEMEEYRNSIQTFLLEKFSSLRFLIIRSMISIRNRTISLIPKHYHHHLNHSKSFKITYSRSNALEKIRKLRLLLFKAKSCIFHIAIYSTVKIEAILTVFFYEIVFLTKEGETNTITILIFIIVSEYEKIF